jgi:hypothetical protein
MQGTIWEKFPKKAEAINSPRQATRIGTAEPALNSPLLVVIVWCALAAQATALN